MLYMCVYLIRIIKRKWLFSYFDGKNMDFCDFVKILLRKEIFIYMLDIFKYIFKGIWYKFGV